jgi:pyruvate ferredoxin oxidoreductase gamma subunit
MYNIRFHGRGGQGIKTASRILGKAFFLEGYEVQDAPRYGAERRGAPIFAYVRASKQTINERGIIQHPDLVIVADDTLVSVPAAGVLQGMDKHSVLLINSHETSEVWKYRLNAEGPIIVLPVTEEIEDRAELPFAGASCAGAAACLAGVISAESLSTAVTDELSDLDTAIVDKNREKALEAFDLMSSHSGLVTEGSEIDPANYTNPGWIDIPFDDASVSAPVIYGGLTSVEVRTGLWRTLRPVIEYDRCKHCWWVCSTYCPDSAIKVTAEGIPEIDYDHCKGCMICVAKCPSHAIIAIPEHEAERDSVKGETT